MMKRTHMMCREILLLDEVLHAGKNKRPVFFDRIVETFHYQHYELDELLFGKSVSVHQVQCSFVECIEYVSTQERVHLVADNGERFVSIFEQDIIFT